MSSALGSFPRCLTLALIFSSLSGCDFLKSLSGGKRSAAASGKYQAVSGAAEKQGAAPNNEEAGKSYSYSAAGDPNCVPQGTAAKGPSGRPGSGVLEGLANGQQAFWDGRSQAGTTLGGVDGRTVKASAKPPCRPKQAVLAARALTRSAQMGTAPPSPIYAASEATGKGSQSEIVKGGPVLMQAYYKFQRGAYKIAYGVLDRVGWKANPLRVGGPAHAPARITVHHTAGHRSDTEEDSAKTVRGIQKLHMSYRIDNMIVSKKEFIRRKNSGEKAYFVKPWRDIGYHFIIDGSGRVIQGRPTDLLASHVSNANRGNIGIALMGDFDKQKPTPEQVESLRRLSSFLAAKYGIDVMNAGAFNGHSHHNRTECPGESLRILLDALRAEITTRAAVAAV